MAVGFIGILVWAPSVYGHIGIALPVAILALVGLVATGVVRRWRWMFWLIVLAFLAGALRLPASVMELAGILGRTGPTWYVVVQAVVGAVQLTIGLALLKGYRNAGVWGAF